MKNGPQLIDFNGTLISDKQEIANGLNKYCEYLNKHILSDALSVIAPLFLDVIDSSLEFGKVPENWKHSLINPSPKIIGSNKCEDLGPINMLPNYEKILEGVVNFRMKIKSS